MHLIDTKSLQLKLFQVPPNRYAILSHTWREEEVLYNDFKYLDAATETKKGFQKIDFLCRQAREDGLGYAWIDTVCIDNSSSAELSEAINSMFMWYKAATTCYVFLDDVEEKRDISDSRWITRGWTLQELIAPPKVEFYNREWMHLGSKASMIDDLSRWTNINRAVLSHSNLLDACSIAERMSWAGNRATTRKEDMAYCLLGIFNVNMPLLYGEGSKAFLRLQQEILRDAHDESILAWSWDFSNFLSIAGRIDHPIGYLATSPALFPREYKVLVKHAESPNTIEMTNKGLRMRVMLLKNTNESKANRCIAILNCRLVSCPDDYIGLLLSRQKSNDPHGRVYSRIATSSLISVSEAEMSKASLEEIMLSIPSESMFNTSRVFRCSMSLKMHVLLSHGYSLVRKDADTIWNAETCTLERDGSETMLLRLGFLHSKTRDAFLITVYTCRVRLNGRHCLSSATSGFMVTSKHPRHANGSTWLDHVVSEPIEVAIENFNQVRYPSRWQHEQCDRPVRGRASLPDKTDMTRVDVRIGEQMLCLNMEMTYSDRNRNTDTWCLTISKVDGLLLLDGHVDGGLGNA